MVLLLQQDTDQHARQVHTLSLQSSASVAVCIAGRLRTFETSRENILQTQITPLGFDAEVFVVVSPVTHDKTRAGRFAKDTTKFKVEEATAVTALFEPLQPFAIDINETTSQQDGLQHCLHMVRARESQRGLKFVWILRLRPDVVYSRSLPPVTTWPKPQGSIVYADGVTRYCRTQDRREGFCVKEIWGLMTRSAADVYMSGRWPGHVKCSGIARFFPVAYGRLECELGCALYTGHVSVARLPITRRILRDWDCKLLENKTDLTLAAYRVGPSRLSTLEAADWANASFLYDHRMHPNSSFACNE